jgi:hypothetical protein
MRSIWGLPVGLLAWLVLTPAADAQNGLERFEREIKPQIELEKFTYAQAEPLGVAGFVLRDIVAVMPPSEATGNMPSTLKIEKITAEEIDFDRLKKENSGDLPRFAKIRFEGMTGDETMHTSLEPYGLPIVPVDMSLDYRLDGAAKLFTLNKLEISFRGQERLALSLVLEGVSDKKRDVDGAKDDARLRAVSLTVDDSGLIAKILPPIAQLQGNSADGLVALALIMLQGIAEAQSPDAAKLLDPLASFVGDWKAPQGPITVTMKPAKAISFTEIDANQDPRALLDALGLAATYSGTRQGAAKAGPATK